MLWIGEALKGVTGAVQAIAGAKNRREAKKEYEALEELDYTDSLAYNTARQSEDIAGRRSQEGLPQEVIDLYTDRASRVLSSGLDSIGSMRGLVTGVSGLATSVLDKNRDIALADAQQRERNMEMWFRQRDTLMREQQRAFDYQMDYDTLNRARLLSEMSAGRDQVNQGLSTLAGGVGGLFANIDGKDGK